MINNIHYVISVFLTVIAPLFEAKKSFNSFKIQVQILIPLFETVIAGGQCQLESWT